MAQFSRTVAAMDAIFDDVESAKGTSASLTAAIAALALADMSNAAAATTSAKGAVMLSNAVNSDSESKAATPAAVKTAYSLLKSTIAGIVDSDAKNIMPFNLADMKTGNSSAGYTWSSNVCTISDGSTLNITVTVNDDGTITVAGSKPATSSGLNFRIVPADNAFNLPLGTYVLSGCPSGGSAATYQLRALINNSSVFAQDNGSAGEFTTTSKAIERIEIVFGTDAMSNFNLTFKPMICAKALWDVSDAFVPFVPSNYQLYDMIKALGS